MNPDYAHLMGMLGAPAKAAANKALQAESEKAMSAAMDSLPDYYSHPTVGTWTGLSKPAPTLTTTNDSTWTLLPPNVFKTAAPHVTGVSPDVPTHPLVLLTLPPMPAASRQVVQDFLLHQGVPALVVYVAGQPMGAQLIVPSQALDTVEEASLASIVDSL